MARTHRAGNTDIYGSAFENGAQIAAAINKMRETRAAEALKAAQQQAMQQRYLQAQSIAAQERQYHHGRDAYHDVVAERNFAFRQQQAQAAARAKMSPAQITPAEAHHQLMDVSANRYLNEVNPPSAVPMGVKGNHSQEVIGLQNQARQRFLSTPDKEGVMPSPAGPAQPFTGGVEGFQQLQAQRIAAQKAITGADAGYGEALAKFPGVTRDYLQQRGDQIPYQLDYRDPATNGVKSFPDKEVAVQLPATIDNPAPLSKGTRKDWMEVLAARAKMASMQQQQQALPQGFPDTLPQPIAEHYPANERAAMMPNAPQAAPQPTVQIPTAQPASPAPAKVAPQYPTMSTVDDALKLPSGTQFLDSEGNLRTRP